MEYIINGKVSPAKYEGMSQYRPPLCFELTGKTFELYMDDGYDCTVTFTDRKTLKYGKAGSELKSYKYDCLKVEEDTYFVNLEMEGDAVKSATTLILDIEQMLVTREVACVGQNPRYPNMVATEITFGAIKNHDGSGAKIPHGYTNDMVGTAIHWLYGTLDVVHVYQTERYYRLIPTPYNTEPRIPREGMEGFNKTWIYEEPCDYIKIKDGIYVFSMTEATMNIRRGSGNNLLFLMNLNRMYDVGRSFGHNGEGELENYTYGAYGKYFDASELMSKPSTEFIR